MKPCPSCDKNKIDEYSYEEGSILICRNCGLQWARYTGRVEKNTSLIDSREGLSNSITNYYMSSGSITSSGCYPPYRSFFRFLETIKPGGSLRILDIGCGNGVFLQECLKLGHDVTGIEADDTMREIIPPGLQSRIIFSPVEKISAFGQPFDVITFWDSFEHLADGFKLLNRLRAYLKNDGIIYLRVNNNYDIFNIAAYFITCLFPSMGKRMLKLCFGFPHHAWNFSRTGISNLLDKNGWQVVSYGFSDTPASRFTKNVLLRCLIELAYLFNRMIRGGKIGEYYIVPGVKGAALRCS
ncbi:MAG: methyltransferase domain-containing protein [Candidatus Omnitrophica bacterium]|nr:methyltransferase domain-containing protein [Candidatus Omnitrophota bacterium]